MKDTSTGRRFLLLLLTGSAILGLAILWPFFTPLVFAVVFAVVLQPVYAKVSRLLKNWPSVAAAATVFLAALCILLPLGLVATEIALQAQHVYVNLSNGDGQAQMQEVISRAEQALGKYVPGLQGFSDSLSANISTYSKQALSWFGGRIGPIFSGLASLLLGSFIFFVALYYLLRDGTIFKRALVDMSPLSASHNETVLKTLALAIKSVVMGSLLLGLIQGTLTTIGFTIFGIPNSILWGTVAAIAALIPGIGTALVFIPAILFLFAMGNTIAALGLLLWGLLAVGMIDNFLGPRLMGRGIKLHPFFILLSVLGGISFFGISGIFLGPIFLSFLFAILSVYASLQKKSETE